LAAALSGPRSESNGIKTVTNEGGKTLGYSATSGVTILTVDRLGFKDLNKNGQLDKYEDWRLSADERAKDLASKMSVEQIAGLMLYSRHQSIPAASRGFMTASLLMAVKISKKVERMHGIYQISKKSFSPPTICVTY
jgi:beta-glucosidase